MWCIFEFLRLSTIKINVFILTKTALLALSKTLPQMLLEKGLCGIQFTNNFYICCDTFNVLLSPFSHLVFICYYSHFVSQVITYTTNKIKWCFFCYHNFLQIDIQVLLYITTVQDELILIRVLMTANYPEIVDEKLH